MAIITLARRRNVRLETCNRNCTNQHLVSHRDRRRLNVGRSAGARHAMREGGENATFSPSVAAVLPVLERTSGPILSHLHAMIRNHEHIIEAQDSYRREYK
jgi:hypothetical protein